MKSQNWNLFSCYSTPKRRAYWKRIKRIYEEKEDWWFELDDEEKTEIEKGIKKAEAGKTITHENLMKEFDKWR